MIFFFTHFNTNSTDHNTKMFFLLEKEFNTAYYDDVTNGSGLKGQ